VTELAVPLIVFEIAPFEAAGPIRFGMTRTEVHAALGDPIRETRNRRGEIDESWGAVSVRYAVEDGRVVEVGLVPPAIATYKGHDVFASPDSMRLLQADDPAPMEYMGFVVFLLLGITLTGFHDDDDSQRAVTAFARGRWDHLRSKLRPFVQS
jgi:hypothetical protein